MENYETKQDKLPWIEKYRPKLLEDIIVEDQIMVTLLQMVKNKNLDNIIITGSPGVGKTSTIKCIANVLYGPYYKNHVLEINASDDRGIKVQEDISNFCRSLLFYKAADKGKYACHKLIIMDEADNITTKAQRLINTIMEKYKDTTRFIFTCNSSYKIIQSIQSRCKIIRYPRLKNKHVVTKLMNICEKEGVKYDKSGLNFIAQISIGDMRSAINVLNNASNKFSKITVNNIQDIYDKPHPEKIKDVLRLCVEGKLAEAFDDITSIKKDGYCSKDILLNMFNVLKSEFCDDFEEAVKIRFTQHISRSMYEISKSSDTDLQLYACICHLVQ